MTTFSHLVLNKKRAHFRPSLCLDLGVKPSKMESSFSGCGFLIFAAILIGVYKYLTRNNDFFEIRGVKFEKPTIIFGNVLGLFTGRDDCVSVLGRPYEKFKDQK